MHYVSGKNASFMNFMFVEQKNGMHFEFFVMTMRSENGFQILRHVTFLLNCHFSTARIIRMTE